MQQLFNLANVAYFSDAHRSNLKDGSFIMIPYSFFIRDRRSLPTLLLRQHDQKFAHLSAADEENDRFPLNFALNDNDVEAYMERWVYDRWDTEASESTNIGRAPSSNKTGRSGKRRRIEHDEQRFSSQQQRCSTLQHETNQDQDVEDGGALTDEDFVIDADEAVEVQNSLRAFSEV